MRNTVSSKYAITFEPLNILLQKHTCKLQTPTVSVVKAATAITNNKRPTGAKPTELTKGSSIAGRICKSTRYITKHLHHTTHL